MPTRPPHKCKHPGCTALTKTGYCEAHEQLHRKAETARSRFRGSPAERGYNYRWRKERAAFLRMHPWCEIMSTHTTPEPATEADHITPHKGDAALFWNKSNWQAGCKACHSKKTAGEDGGFGNPRKKQSKK